MAMALKDCCPVCRKLKHPMEGVCTECAKNPVIMRKVAQTVGVKIDANIRDWYSRPRTIGAIR